MSVRLRELSAKSVVALSVESIAEGIWVLSADGTFIWASIVVWEAVGFWDSADGAEGALVWEAVGFWDSADGAEGALVWASIAEGIWVLRAEGALVWCGNWVSKSRDVAGAFILQMQKFDLRQKSMSTLQFETHQESGM